MNDIFEIGSIVYFYYDDNNMFQKGQIANYVGGKHPYYVIKLIYKDPYDKVERVSTLSRQNIAPEYVFATEKECIQYKDNIIKQCKNNILEELNSKEKLFQKMFCYINMDMYGSLYKKAMELAFKERIKEYFDVEV